MSQPPNPWSQGSWPQGRSPQQPGQPDESGKPTLVNSMAIATELWLVVVLCQAIAYIGEYSSAADSVRSATRDSSSKLSGPEADMMNSTGFLVGVFVAVGIVVAAVSLLIVWLARTGHNWARLVLSFFSAFLVVQAVLALFEHTGPTWVMVPTLIGGVAALGAAYLLLQRDTETYCRAMATYRKTGGTPPGWPQGDPGVPPGQYFPSGNVPQGPYGQQGGYPPQQGGFPQQGGYPQQGQYPQQGGYPYPPQQYSDPRDQQAPYDPHQPRDDERPDSDAERGK